MKQKNGGMFTKDETSTAIKWGKLHSLKLDSDSCISPVNTAPHGSQTERVWEWRRGGWGGVYWAQHGAIYMHIVEQSQKAHGKTTSSTDIGHLSSWWQWKHNSDYQSVCLLRLKPRYIPAANEAQNLESENTAVLSSSLCKDYSSKHLNRNHLSAAKSCFQINSVV